VRFFESWKLACHKGRYRASLTWRAPSSPHLACWLKKEGIQLIPVSEVAAKDEFNSIKNKTLKDVLAALRVYPQLMGIVSKNAGGFGSSQEATSLWAILELESIQTRLALLNDLVGEEVVRFKPFELGMRIILGRSRKSRLSAAF